MSLFTPRGDNMVDLSNVSSATLAEDEPVPLEFLPSRSSRGLEHALLNIQ